jgi:hypothetical protein
VKARTLLIVVLVGLAAVLAAIRFGAGRRGGENPLFKNLTSDQVARIVVNTADTTVVLRKADDIWFVASEDSLPAEAGVGDEMVRNMTEFSRKDMISSNPDKYSLYQVDSAGVRVTASDAQGDTLASFVVGKPGPDYQSTYVRDLASGDVILAPGYLRPMFDRGKRSWQDRTIFAFQPDAFVEITIRRPGGTITLLPDETGKWFVSGPESVACNANRMTRLIRTLAYLKCDDFGGRMPMPSSGLAEADSAVGFRTGDGIAGELVFGNLGDDRRVFAKRMDSDVVYLLSTQKVATMMPHLVELRAAETDASKGMPPEKGQ